MAIRTAPKSYATAALSVVTGLAILFYILVSLINHAAGATTTSSGGITVYPAVVELNSSAATDATITVQNNSTVSAEFTAQIRGVSQSQSGDLFPSDSGDETLINSLSITPSSFSIESGKSVNLGLSLADSASLSGGGHYASIFIKQVGGQGQVSLSSAVHVSIFAIKEQGAVRALRATSVDFDGNLFRIPKTVILDFANTGNSLVIPRAHATVSTGSTVLASAVINADSVPVLPQKLITLQTNMRNLKQQLLPGRVMLAVNYRYDGADTAQSLTKQRWYVPPAFATALIVLLTVLGYVIRILYRRYTRVVPQSQQHAAKKPKAMDVIIR